MGNFHFFKGLKEYQHKKNNIIFFPSFYPWFLRFYPNFFIILNFVFMLFLMKYLFPANFETRFFSNLFSLQTICQILKDGIKDPFKLWTVSHFSEIQVNVHIETGKQVFYSEKKKLRRKKPIKLQILQIFIVNSVNLSHSCTYLTISGHFCYHSFEGVCFCCRILVPWQEIPLQTTVTVAGTR